jgi:ParB family chromosome partitioning protein
VNEHRAELDDVEQVLAMKELEQLGVSAAAIARRTGAKRKVVDGALAVAASEAATAALRDQQLSFDAAIAVAEFEGDPAAQERIVRMGASSYSIAQERERRAVEERKAQLEADGVKVIDRPDFYDARIREVTRLYLDEELTKGLGDLDHDALVGLAGDGLRAFVDLVWSSSMTGRETKVRYAVSDWRDRGLFGHELSTSSTPKPETPEEVAAAKEERRRARETTKAWTTATTVRVVWLQEVLQRKAMPKGWELLAARQALGELYGYPWSTVLGLLGLSRSDNGLGKYDVVKYLDEHPAKAAQVALALALGSIEGARDFDRKVWQSSGVKAYLELLASWGYELSDVERELVGVVEAVAA